nr:hypothetical protein [Halorubrum sp. ARQ200]
MTETSETIETTEFIELVYLPEARHTTDLDKYTYPYEYFAAGPSRVTIEDSIYRCVHCETNVVNETYTCCPNCGAITCDSHPRPNGSGRNSSVWAM